jgi:predicted permease
MHRVFRIPFSRFRLVREAEDEILFHLELRIKQLVASGMSPDEARAAAHRQFGDVAGVREQIIALDRQRETKERRGTFFADIRQDVVYGLRTLRRNAALTALVVGGLALGIGANAAIYSLIDAVLVRKLPVKHADRLVIVGDPGYADSRGHGTPDGHLYSYATYTEIRGDVPALDGLAAVGYPGRIDAQIDGGAAELEHPHGRLVSGNFFDVLGVGAAAGRTLDASADDPAAEAQTTISYEYWTRRFHNEPSIVGQRILVDGVRATITGVAMPGFTGDVVGARTDMWLPVSLADRFHPDQPLLRDRRMMWLLFFGRMRDGVTLEQVRAQASPRIKASVLAHATPGELSEIKDRKGFTMVFAPGARGLSTVRDSFRAPLVTLMLGVALLLCIVCVNVANLLLARGVARSREMSLRLAIGADRARIVRQLLTESLLLALIADAVAVLAAYWGSRALVAMASEGDPISIATGVNVRVLGFTLGLSITAVLLFGLVPALRASRVDLATTLRSTARSLRHRARFGSLLIAAQVALSLLLLVGASILTNNLRRTESIPLGFDRDHLIVADLDIGTPGYSNVRLAAIVHAIRDRVAALPGVAGVSYSQDGIFSGTEWHTTVHVAGFNVRAANDSLTASDEAGAGYAHAIGARVIAGRDLDASDEDVTPHTALINESFARFYFNNANPIGRSVAFDDSSVVQIVGEIADVRGQSLDTTGAPGAARRIYIPLLHRSGTTKFSQPDELRLLVRAAEQTRGPAALVQSVRRAITETDRAIAIDDLGPVAQRIRLSIRGERLVTRLANGLGVLALVLAAIGLYGVTSYTIARRTNEIGLRIALGASQTDVARLVVRDALRPVMLGILLGVPVSILAVRALEQHLNNIEGDPRAGAVAVAVLLASVGAAVAIPARRAMRIEPVGALREE